MPSQTQLLVEQHWEESILPTLKHYIEIPCKSVAFDSDWEKNGYIDQAVRLISDWCHAQNIVGITLKVHKLPGKTPLILIDIPGQSNFSVLFYGHIDKQPEMVGWDPDLAPWKAVLKGDRLYGRGAADDGYAIFCAISAIKALQTQNLPHPHCSLLIEASEESGSIDLPAYMGLLQDQIPAPDLVIGLDSGAGNYEQLWVTTSLRGIINGVLTVDILTEGVHSGEASGVVPSSFRIIRELLSRIEDEKTGTLLLDTLHVTIPAERSKEIAQVADILGEHSWQDYPWVEGAKPSLLSAYELILNRTWRPTLSITGVGGIPSIADAGNVLRPSTSLALSLRIPPTADRALAAASLKKTLEANPPYGAKVDFAIREGSHGWNAPPTASWLAAVLDEASHLYYGKPALYWGEGGSIPFMYLLGEKFPHAQFLITGVLGPHSNAHGPNEFLHIPMVKKLTNCLTEVLRKTPNS